MLLLRGRRESPKKGARLACRGSAARTRPPIGPPCLPGRRVGAEPGGSPERRGCGRKVPANREATPARCEVGLPRPAAFPGGSSVGRARASPAPPPAGPRPRPRPGGSAASGASSRPRSPPSRPVGATAAPQGPSASPPPRTMTAAPPRGTRTRRAEAAGSCSSWERGRDVSRAGCWELWC